MSANTLFLRLEGHMQAWGDQESKFVIRRTAEAPTKSGVIGMLCAALGISRSEAPVKWLPELSGMHMGVRIDSPGIRWWDYHTVGAGMDMRIAEGEGKTKPGAMLTRREYLCDASFLVAIQGDAAIVATLEEALQNPKWTLYLGRKSCPPSRPILSHVPGKYSNLMEALKSIPWQRRLKSDPCPERVDCLLDWIPSDNEPEAPEDALIWYDVPLTFEPPSHRPRFVIRKQFRVAEDGEITLIMKPLQQSAPAPSRPRADYGNTEFRKKRQQRLDLDRHLCIVCKSPATTVQHTTYRRAGGDECLDDLRSLCRLCHDAVTMIEYGMGMGIDRINPEEPNWREKILEKRKEIVEFRSLETRRRKLAAKEVE